ncbi:unnamed protein product [Somion occarium]|uniref:C2H2-type domain-containing protein n=1 Tax=Somion occarium TaxID=3059160 RepID=A0ABP1DRY4_9APHY
MPRAITRSTSLPNLDTRAVPSSDLPAFDPQAYNYQVVCCQCLEEFETSAELLEHIGAQHRNKLNDQFVCPWPPCSRTFNNKAWTNCMTHFKTHPQIKDLECPYAWDPIKAKPCTFFTSDHGSYTRHKKNVHGYIPQKTGRGATKTRSDRIHSKPYDRQDKFRRASSETSIMSSSSQDSYASSSQESQWSSSPYLFASESSSPTGRSPMLSTSCLRDNTPFACTPLNLTSSLPCVLESTPAQVPFLDQPIAVDEFDDLIDENLRFFANVHAPSVPNPPVLDGAFSPIPVPSQHYPF